MAKHKAERKTEGCLIITCLVVGLLSITFLWYVLTH